MSLTLPPDEGRPARTGGPRFEVVVRLPKFLERLIERLVAWHIRRMTGGA